VNSGTRPSGIREEEDEKKKKRSDQEKFIEGSSRRKDHQGKYPQTSFIKKRAGGKTVQGKTI